MSDCQWQFMSQKDKVIDLQNKPARKADTGSAAVSPVGSGKAALATGPRGPGPKPGARLVVETVFPPGDTPLAGPNSNSTGLGTQNPTFALASAAHLNRRHWGLIYGLFLLVLLPVLAAATYLYTVAEDQYASTTGFTVRQQEGGGASAFLSGLAGFAGTGGSSDTDILYEFTQSQEIVSRIDTKLDLRSHYAQHWATDKLFSIWPNADIEDLQWFWSRIVRISYDKSAGMIEIRVLAFDPAYAQAVAQEIVAESQTMINDLSNTARADATRYAKMDLNEALMRLKGAREALTEFRTRTRIVDPAADLQGRLGVMNNLQQQLAQALISYDLLLENSRAADPRLQQAEQRIAVIRARISSERDAFATGGDDVGAVGDDYPSLIAEFERLTVDRVYAEETYRASLAAVDIARAKAARLSRYLATFIEPTLAQSTQYPKRGLLIGLTMLFMILAWSILALIYYSIRDRR
jgi:capsular polysaccharide transport system permease protein